MSNQFAVSEVYRKDMRCQPGDAYWRSHKYPSDTGCPKCGLVFRSGVWKWETPKSPIGRKLCPACRQIRDDCPGGVLSLEGSFFILHREDILNRVRKLEKQVLAEHPLERIIRIEDEGSEAHVYATGEHLVVRIGKALRRDFGGNLEIKFAREDKFATACWKRD